MHLLSNSPPRLSLGQGLGPALLCAALLTIGAGGCGDDGTTTTGESESETNATTGLEKPTTGSPLDCDPGAVSCKGYEAVRICNPDGVTYTEVPCGDREQCTTGKCMGPCEFAEATPSSVGCSFIAARMTHWRPDSPDALIVGNTDQTETAKVTLWHVPDNIRTETLLSQQTLAPGEQLLFDMTNEFVAGLKSGFRTGGIYRVESDIPIVAYQHSPLENSAANDSSMLLPQHTLRQDYVVYSYPGFQDKNNANTHGKPSYFSIIALDFDTNVEWTPPVDTDGDNLAVEPVKAGNTGRKLMNKYDIIQIAASDSNDEPSLRDVSGTIVTSDKPVWVVGATACAFVPFYRPFTGQKSNGYCDHLQEMLIPVEHWGTTYVGVNAPVRHDEYHYWRVFAGDDDTKIWVFPQLEKFTANPITLEKKGDFYEFAVDPGTSLLFHGNKPFMPVQYLAGARELADDVGDPSMYAMVPVEQYLDRYAFTTGANYAQNFVQISRKLGGADVFVDGVKVEGYTTLAKGGEVGGIELDEYEVVNWPIEDGAHFAESDEPFGITNVGYAEPNVEEQSGYASYAYPGGMNLEIINPL